MGGVEVERPRILGVLLDAVVMGLRMLPQTRLERPPRMADFALWATACETALWPAGTFWSAYCGNRDEAVEGVIDADPVASAVRAMMTTRTVWTGTASDLLGALAEVVGERIAKSKAWPDNARALSGRLRRAATFLRKIGIMIEYTKEGRARTRTIRITSATPSSSAENEGTQPSAPSAPSASRQKYNSTNDLAGEPARAVDIGADGRADDTKGGDTATVRANPLKTNDKTDADGADANFPDQSGLAKSGQKRWRATDCERPRSPQPGSGRRGRNRDRWGRSGAGGCMPTTRRDYRGAFLPQGRDLALLRPSSDGWKAEDWQAYYDKHAGIAEFDAGISRRDAEARAFECCVVEWMNRHPEPSDPGHCAWCKRQDQSGHTVVPFGVDGRGHTWLHPECWAQWHQDRRKRAQAASIGDGHHFRRGWGKSTLLP